MCYYDEDFYEKPSEFDAEIEKLKKKLASSIKQNFLDVMYTLRKENESLREFRDQKAAFEQELEQIKSAYAIKIRNAEIDANRKKLKDLMSQFSVIGYRVKIKYTQGKKCNKCDKDRKIHFVSPGGRNMTEDCSCAARIPHYSPKEVSLVSFDVSKELSSVYYEMTNNDSDYDRYEMCAHLYDKDRTQPFEKINRYRVVFLNIDDCQAYCDWLNENPLKKE